MVVFSNHEWTEGKTGRHQDFSHANQTLKQWLCLYAGMGHESPQLYAKRCQHTNGCVQQPLEYHRMTFLTVFCSRHENSRGLDRRFVVNRALWCYSTSHNINGDKISLHFVFISSPTQREKKSPFSALVVKNCSFSSIRTSALLFAVKAHSYRPTVSPTWIGNFIADRECVKSHEKVK